MIGVPAIAPVATVCIDGAEGFVDAAYFDFVGEVVTGQGGVVGLNVEFEMFFQFVLAQEGQHRGAIEVVLVLGGLAGFWFDEELPLKADLLGVIDGHVEEFGSVICLAAHVGVEQADVAFATTPEDVVFTTEFEGNVEHLFHRVGAVGNDVSAGAGARTLGKAWMREHVGGAPEELDAGLASAAFAWRATFQRLALV